MAIPVLTDLITATIGRLAVPQLTGVTRRLAIRSILTEFIRTPPPFPTATLALAEFRNFGLGIATADFGRIYRTFRDEGALVGRQVTQPSNQAVTPLQMPEGGRNLPEQFRYGFERRFTDPETGRRTTEFFFLDTPTVMSPDNALAELRTRFDPDRYPSLHEPDALTFRGAFRRPAPF